MALLTACDNSHQPASTGTSAYLRSYEGYINGKIPVSAWYSVKDSVLAGQLTYTNTKSRNAIRLIGTVRKEGIVMQEFMPDGNITGIWSGKVAGNIFSGKWAAPGSGKEMDFRLEEGHSAQNAPATVFTMDNITGSYTYQYGKDGGMGSLDVKKLDDHHIIYNASAVTPAPAYNQATVTDDTLELKGNEAVYSANNETGACSYRIRFFKDFIIVDSPKEEYECGFGLGASVIGIYVKTSNVYTSLQID